MELFIALITLVLLEVVLGIDNIIFISIVTGRLPLHQQKKGRRIGLLLAMVMRLLLLTAISFILKLQKDLFNVFSIGIPGKELIPIAGRLVLLLKNLAEIYQKWEVNPGNLSKNIKYPVFAIAIGKKLGSYRGVSLNHHHYRPKVWGKNLEPGIPQFSKTQGFCLVAPQTQKPSFVKKPPSLKKGGP